MHWMQDWMPLDFVDAMFNIDNNFFTLVSLDLRSDPVSIGWEGRREQNGRGGFGFRFALCAPPLSPSLSPFWMNRGATVRSPCLSVCLSPVSVLPLCFDASFLPSPFFPSFADTRIIRYHQTPFVAFAPPRAADDDDNPEYQ